MINRPYQWVNENEINGNPVSTNETTKSRKDHYITTSKEAKAKPWVLHPRRKGNTGKAIKVNRKPVIKCAHIGEKQRKKYLPTNTECLHRWKIVAWVAELNNLWRKLNEKNCVSMSRSVCRWFLILITRVAGAKCALTDFEIISDTDGVIECCLGQGGKSTKEPKPKYRASIWSESTTFPVFEFLKSTIYARQL